MPKDISLYSANKRYKLIFFDIDGTLIGSNHTIHRDDIEEIARVKDQGIHICLASGRPCFAAHNTISQLKIDDLCMFYSGAMVWDAKQKKPISEFPVSSELLNGLIEDLLSAEIYFELYTSEGYFVNRKSSFSDIHAHYLGQLPQETSLRDLIEKQRVLKLGTISESDNKDTLLNISEKHPNIHFHIGKGAAHADLDFASFSSSGACRSERFEDICRHYRIDPSETVAMGDSVSDIIFLQLAGAGVAMGNSMQQAKEEADFVTDSVDECGVAKALKVMFPG